MSTEHGLALQGSTSTSRLHKIGLVYRARGRECQRPGASGCGRMRNRCRLGDGEGAWRHDWREGPGAVASGARDGYGMAVVRTRAHDEPNPIGSDSGALGRDPSPAGARRDRFRPPGAWRKRARYQARTDRALRLRHAWRRLDKHPALFDVASLKWSRPYPNDEPSTYGVSKDGSPVAGIDGSRPWAMHTFAAVTYDRLNDQLIVASYPQHLEPGRFTDVMAHVWPKIRRHPTWLFDMGAERWRPLESAAVHFFPFATAYDSHRAVVMGYRPDGIYELPMSEANPSWRKVASASHSAYTQTPSTTRAEGSSSLLVAIATATT